MNLKRFLNYSELVTYVEKNKKLFTDLYIKQNLTARKVAENQNIFYEENFQKGNGIGWKAAG